MASFSKAVFLFSFVAIANAFVPSPFGVQPSTTAVFITEAVAETPVEEEVVAPAAPARNPSDMNLRVFRKSIRALTTENFSQTLSNIEPFLLNDAGSTLYAKSMRRISTQANLLGQNVPEGYARDAAATQKRREKQDAFIKAKEEERMAAEAEAAEAAADAQSEAESTDEAAEETVAEPEPVMA